MILAIAKNSFLILQRDKIFIPVLIALAVCGLVASMSSDWSIENLFDTSIMIGTLSFHSIGAVVSIFWGVRLFGNTMSDGSIEVELSSSIARYKWALGKFLGFSYVLILIAILFAFMWGTILYVQDNLYYFLEPHFINFTTHFVLWLVLGSMSFFVSTLVNQGLAVFASFSLWIAGMISPLIIVAIKGPNLHSDSFMAEQIAKIWDLQRLNLLERSLDYSSMLSWSEATPNILYGLFLTVFFLSATCYRIEKMDLSR